MASGGLSGQTRVRSKDPRARRNSNALTNSADTIVSGVLSVDNDGKITITFGANSGLEDKNPGLGIDLSDVSGLEILSADPDFGLQVKAHDGIVLSASGTALNLDTDPALEFTSGAVRVKIKTAGGLIRDADGLSVDAATATDKGGVLKSAASADSSQDTVTLTATTDPLDTPATADALRDDLTDTVLPGYATRDTELETAIETLATEHNDLLAKLRTAGILTT